MEISKEVQTALIHLVSLAKAVTAKDLVKDDGSIETIEQFLFDCEVDEEKFEAFPRLSMDDLNIDEERQLLKEEREHYADYSDQREGDL